MVLGSVAKQRDAALLLLLPVVGHHSSSVGVYPFAARLIVFLLPSFLLATAAGAGHLLNHWPPRFRWLSPLALAILGGSPVYAAVTALPPSFVQHMRPVLEHISERRSSGDGIYVYYGAALPFAITHHVLTGNGCVVFGPVRACRTAPLLEDLDAAGRGRRLWVVATHVPRAGEANCCWVSRPHRPTSGRHRSAGVERSAMRPPTGTCTT